MKIKTTNKSIRDGSRKIISIGYGEAQYLLQGVEPFAYTCGIHGHNADFYQVGNVIISTGSRPIGERKSYDITKEYEERARKIWLDERSYNIYNHAQRKVDSNTLLLEYISK